MTTTTTLDEFSRLLETFKQLVKAGMQVNLSAWTDKEGNLKAKLDVKFCPAATPSSLPSKPPVSSPVAQAPGQPAAGRRRKRRGPAARERARARAACYRAAKAAAAAAQGGSSSASEGDKVSSAPEQTPTPPPPPPPPPPTSTARLVKVVERKAGSRLTFSQLDGEDGSEVDLDSEEDTEGEGELIRGVVYCIFCFNMKEPNPVEPISFIDKFGMKPKVKVSCDNCNVKGSDIGICYNCHCMNEFYALIYNNRSTCPLCKVAALAAESHS